MKTLDDAPLFGQTGAGSELDRANALDELRSQSWLARGFVGDTCARWRVAPSVTETLQLVVTELVANAVVHAGTPMQLIIRRSHRHIHLAVVDEERRPAVLRGPPSPRSPGGRGLLLVEAFSAAWGCTPTATGKSTWATVRHVGWTA